MAEKAKKSAKTKKTTRVSKNNIYKIICFIIGALAIVAVIIALVIALINRAPDDSYFVTDDNKYVLNVQTANPEDSDEAIKNVHVVYQYEGDSITESKTYYEFLNHDIAKAAYEDLISNLAENDESIYEVKGKFIIVTAPAAAIENLHVEDVKSQIEFYEAIQRGETPTGTAEDIIVEESEEESEE